eukprot:SAG11_NODE_21552_length_423_cov_0.679012_1_plen_54_part_01
MRAFHRHASRGSVAIVSKINMDMCVWMPRMWANLNVPCVNTALSEVTCVTDTPL